MRLVSRFLQYLIGMHCPLSQVIYGIVKSVNIVFRFLGVVTLTPYCAASSTWS